MSHDDTARRQSPRIPSGASLARALRSVLGRLRPREGAARSGPSDQDLARGLFLWVDDDDVRFAGNPALMGALDAGPTGIRGDLGRLRPDGRLHLTVVPPVGGTLRVLTAGEGSPDRELTTDVQVEPEASIEFDLRVDDRWPEEGLLVLELAGPHGPLVVDYPFSVQRDERA